MTIYYFFLIISSVLLALQFGVTNLYQKSYGTGLEKGLFFSALTGFFSFILFFAVNGFRLSFNPYTIAFAASIPLLVVTYTTIGFEIMKKSTVAVYSFFLMTGGMIVPYVWGLFFLDEVFSYLRTSGLILIIASMFTMNSGGCVAKGKQAFLCLAVFFLNGFVSVLLKLHQISPVTGSESDYVIFAGLAQTIVCGLIFIVLKRRGGKKESPTTFGHSLKIVAVLFAAALLSGVSSRLQLTGAKYLPASVVYPIISGGSIIFTSIIGAIMFREKMTRRQAVSIAVCFVGTCLFL